METMTKYIIQHGENAGYVRLKQNKTGLYEVSLNVFCVSVPADFATFDNLEKANAYFEKLLKDYSY